LSSICNTYSFGINNSFTFYFGYVVIFAFALASGFFALESGGGVAPYFTNKSFKLFLLCLTAKLIGVYPLLSTL